MTWGHVEEVRLEPTNLMNEVTVDQIAKHHSLALREFALGIEALERFVRQEPLSSRT